MSGLAIITGIYWIYYVVLSAANCLKSKSLEQRKQDWILNNHQDNYGTLLVDSDDELDSQYSDFCVSSFGIIFVHIFRQ